MCSHNCFSNGRLSSFLLYMLRFFWHNNSQEVSQLFNPTTLVFEVLWCPVLLDAHLDTEMATRRAGARTFWCVLGLPHVCPVWCPVVQRRERIGRYFTLWQPTLVSTDIQIMWSVASSCAGANSVKNSFRWSLHADPNCLSPRWHRIERASGVKRETNGNKVKVERCKGRETKHEEQVQAALTM